MSARARADGGGARVHAAEAAAARARTLSQLRAAVRQRMLAKISAIRVELDEQDDFLGSQELEATADQRRDLLRIDALLRNNDPAVEMELLRAVYAFLASAAPSAELSASWELLFPAVLLAVGRASQARVHQKSLQQCSASDVFTDWAAYAPQQLSAAQRAEYDQHAAPGTGVAFIHADRMDAVLDRTRAVTDGRYRYVHHFMPERPRRDGSGASVRPLGADRHPGDDGARRHLFRWSRQPDRHDGRQLQADPAGRHQGGL